MAELPNDKDVRRLRVFVIQERQLLIFRLSPFVSCRRLEQLLRSGSRQR